MADAVIDERELARHVADGLVNRAAGAWKYATVGIGSIFEQR
jgi:hypothetical protein